MHDNRAGNGTVRFGTTAEAAAAAEAAAQAAVPAVAGAPAGGLQADDGVNDVELVLPPSPGCEGQHELVREAAQATQDAAALLRNGGA
jgi:hypothetical protein